MDYQHWDYQHWVDHFIRNRQANVAVDAAIDWTAPPTVASPALTESIRTFELGERGDGHVLLRKARHSDPVYQRALRAFVGEEGQHAGLLGECLRHLGSTPIATHWSNSAFIAVRRMLTLRWELMVLSCAELIALTYYAALRDCGDEAVAAMSDRILADEVGHIAFHTDRLHDDFRRSPRAVVAGYSAAWSAAIVATIAVFLLGHGRAMAACGWSRRRVALAVIEDFRTMRRAVAGRSSTSRSNTSRSSTGRSGADDADRTASDRTGRGPVDRGGRILSADSPPSPGGGAPVSGR